MKDLGHGGMSIFGEEGQPLTSGRLRVQWVPRFSGKCGKIVLAPESRSLEPRGTSRCI